VRVMAGVLAPDPRAATAALDPACRAYARVHSGRGAAASQCWFEVGWLANERGDHAAAIEAMEQVVLTEKSGGQAGRVGLARAYLALARGDPAAAAGFAAVLEQLGPTAKKPWWVRWIAAEAELGAGLARRDTSPRAAQAALDRARVEFEAVAAAQPAVYIERRLARARAELARLRAARGAPSHRIAPLARAAATWYRAAGGYGDVLAELAPLAGDLDAQGLAVSR